MKQRLPFALDSDPIAGPFPTLDAVSIVGWSRLQEMARNGTLLWADSGKSSYWSMRKISGKLGNSELWYYKLPRLSDPIAAHHGRIKIYTLSDDRYVLKDYFTKEFYLARSLPAAFELAVWIAFFYPDERTIPDVVSETKLPALPPVKAMAYPGSQITAGGTAEWTDHGAYTSTHARPVVVGIDDAVAMLEGAAVSDALVSALCDTFPQALLSTYGAPLIGYDLQTTELKVARSLTHICAAYSITVPSGIRSFAARKQISTCQIVGGWGLPYLLSVSPDAGRVAIANMVLSSASSPASLEAMIRSHGDW